MEGIGVKPNRERALYLYRRAYRSGLGGAASNIGCLFRDEKNSKPALAWFKRANDGDADLAIAKMYLDGKDKTNAIRYLKKAVKAIA